MSDARASLMECGHKPSPWSGAYGNWYCQLPYGHNGRHRFNNYTWRRGARVWGGFLYGIRRWRLAATKALGLARPWRVVLRRTNTKYDPCDLLALYERTRSDG